MTRKRKPYCITSSPKEATVICTGCAWESTKPKRSPGYLEEVDTFFRAGFELGQQFAQHVCHLTLKHEPARGTK